MSFGSNHALVRELPDPPKIMAYLLQPSTLFLPSGTVYVFIQAAMKIFGTWVVDLAGRWNDDFLPEVKQTVDMVVSGLQSFVTSEGIEVQERVSPRHVVRLSSQICNSFSRRQPTHYSYSLSYTPTFLHSSRSQSQ